MLYELHVGTFATGGRAGTFDGVRRKLDHLAALGITAIELMPVAHSPANAAGAMTACCSMRRIGAMADRKD